MPCGKSLKDVENLLLDIELLKKKCQCHKCSAYCMRMMKKSTSHRYCRSGAGQEATPFECDTPGFELHDKAKLKKQLDYKSLHMPRNDNRLYQTSVYTLMGWRGNCDLKLLLYEMENDSVSPEEIARVTDYIVGYTCKGNNTLDVERNLIKDFILSQEECFGTQRDVVSIARSILHKATGSRCIPKQECMVELCSLPLVICTEIIEDVSISGSYKISSTDNKCNKLLNDYKAFMKEATEEEAMSLMEYFKENKPGIIPNFIGGSGQPKYPVTKEYARTTLLIHRPWINGVPTYFEDFKSCIDEFKRFVNSDICPSSVKSTYDTVRRAFYRKTEEVTAPEMNYVTHENLPADVDEAVREAVELSSTLGNRKLVEEFETHGLNFGKEYNWSQRLPNVSVHIFRQLQFIK